MAMSQIHYDLEGNWTAAELQIHEAYRDVGRVLALDALGRTSEADRALAVTEEKYAGSLNIRLLRFMPAAMNRTKLLYGWSVLTNGAVDTLGSTA
jgi:hypothetical protein